MGLTSFTEQQDMLREKLADAELFSGELFNYIKVVQHALTYDMNQDERKLLRNPWGRPARFVRMYYGFRSRRDRRKAKAPMLTSVLFLENGRYVTDASGKVHSAHYEILRAAVDASVQTTWLTRANSPIKNVDGTIRDLIDSVNPFPLSPHGQELLNDLNRVVRRMAKSGRFTRRQIGYISSSAHVFFEQFLGFDALFRDRGAEVCIFDNHYHNEGLIAALKLNGIRCVEIQHGLIAASDLYYAYPDYMHPVRDKALFPEKLLLFGNYWKEVLKVGHEHDESQLEVVGDYTWFGDRPLPLAVQKRKLVLITAQKNNVEAFVSYTRKLNELLKAEHPGWKVAVKMHPLERDPDSYYALEDEGVAILGNESNLMDELAAARIHISINSTTFFDAIGLDTMNLSLQNYGVSADYAREMVDAGVALPILEDDDPVALYEATPIEETSFGDRQHFYQTFDPELFRKAIGIRREVFIES